MRAKAPLDVDLEDKLLYGLTPARLGYLVLGLLAGMTAWSGAWAPTPVRACICLGLVGAGAVAAWGRWRGRGADEWLADVAAFAVRTRTLAIDHDVVREWTAPIATALRRR